jgi:hypothetical protein
MSMSPANHFEGIMGSKDIGSADTYIDGGGGGAGLGCRDCAAAPVHSQVIPTAPVATTGRVGTAAMPVEVPPLMPIDKPPPVQAVPLSTFVPTTIGDPPPPPTPMFTAPTIGADVVNGDVYVPTLPPPPMTAPMKGAQGRLPCC